MAVLIHNHVDDALSLVSYHLVFHSNERKADRTLRYATCVQMVSSVTACSGTVIVFHKLDGYTRQWIAIGIGNDTYDITIDFHVSLLVVLLNDDGVFVKLECEACRCRHALQYFSYWLFGGLDGNVTHRLEL